MTHGLNLEVGPGRVPRILVIGAHPDNETFGCGSLLLRAAAEAPRDRGLLCHPGAAGEPPRGAQVPGGAPRRRALLPRRTGHLDWSDGHRDHVVVRDATVRLADDSTSPPTYLQCLPRSLMQQWWRARSAIGPETEHRTLGELGTPDEQIDLVLDQHPHLGTGSGRSARFPHPDVAVRRPAHAAAPRVPWTRPSCERDRPAVGAAA